MPNDDTILVTGASGFVGSHCVLQLLEQGYRVRAAVRDIARGRLLEKMLVPYAGPSGGRLSLVEADLARDDGWEAAARGCWRILHVASPVPKGVVSRPEEVIGPARDGTLRVLMAAKAARVKRVVMTSSTAAVIWGHARDGSTTYDENHWTKLTERVAPYEQSKTLAERAAWDYVAGLPKDDRFELVVLNPGLVLGPLLGDNASVSGEVVRKLLAGDFPGCPDLGFAAVDVRDVAAAHLTAMVHAEAPGQRFILATNNVAMLDIAKILRHHYGKRGFNVPVRKLPSWALRLVAKFDKTAALVVPELGKRQDVSSDKARSMLGFRPRDLETMVVDMAESMIKLGIVRPRRMGRATIESATDSIQ